MFDMFINLQLFAAGNVVNATTGYVNAYTGDKTEFSGTNTLSPTMKTYYDTELLENARSQFFFEQFGRKQALPANRGRTLEWRKWNTLPNAPVLQEGVIPDGHKMGMTTLNASIEQYGMYVAITDVLELHAIDNVLLGATEELGASAGETRDILIRNVLQTGTNVMFADTVSADGTKTTPTGYGQMKADNNRLTPDMVNKAATWLKKMKAPTINGKYVAIIHPSVTYDIRSAEEWVEAHKYAATTEIFNGEIGELHGVRFVESHNAKITSQSLNSGSGMVYSTIFLGKDAYGIIDVSGGGMEMIIKDKAQAGGPLEQFSTAGYKFEDATKILYPERLLRVESCSTYSSIDSEN
jgi:N4-gp56 family major capsid protein